MLRSLVFHPCFHPVFPPLCSPLCSLLVCSLVFPRSFPSSLVLPHLCPFVFPGALCASLVSRPLVFHLWVPLLVFPRGVRPQSYGALCSPPCVLPCVSSLVFSPRVPQGLPAPKVTEPYVSRCFSAPLFIPFRSTPCVTFLVSVPLCSHHRYLRYHHHSHHHHHHYHHYTIIVIVTA